MTTRRFLTGLLLAAVAGLCASPVWARDHGGYGGHHHGGGHDHFRFGLYMGDPFYSVPYRYAYPYPYYGPYYSPPTVITVPQPAPPPVYIQQSPPPASQQALPSGYWYYCRDPEGYYPYIKACESGWEQVPPTPADAR